MKLYRIKNWESIYENNRSRTVKDLAWVAIPNRHDGEGYSSIMAHSRSAEIFAAWILMLQVASRCQPRGSLMRDHGRPHTPQSMALKTRAKPEWFVLALELLTSEEIGWIEAVELPENEALASTHHPPDSPLTGSCQAGDYRTEQNGMEWNRTEQEGIRPHSTPAVEHNVRRFVKPKLDEVKLQAAKLGLPSGEAEKFFNYYESNGWRVGRNPMKSWTAALVNWRKNWEERHSPGSQEPQQRGEILEIPRL